MKKLQMPLIITIFAFLSGCTGIDSKELRGRLIMKNGHTSLEVNGYSLKPGRGHKITFEEGLFPFTSPTMIVTPPGQYDPIRIPLKGLKTKGAKFSAKGDDIGQVFNLYGVSSTKVYKTSTFTKVESCRISFCDTDEEGMFACDGEETVKYRRTVYRDSYKVTFQDITSNRTIAELFASQTNYQTVDRVISRSFCD